MLNVFSKIIILTIFALLLTLVLAGQNPSRAVEDLEISCQLEKIEESCKGILAQDCRKILEKCEEYYKKKSAEIETDIKKTEKEKRTLKETIQTLEKKIKNLDYQIQQSNLVIKDLSLQIDDTTLSIEKTSRKIEDSTAKLATVLQEIHEEDQKGAVEILLSGETLSDFFDNVLTLEILNEKNKNLLRNIKDLKQTLEGQKEALSGEKDDFERIVKIQTLQKDESSKTKKDKEYFLKLTEKEYQKQLQDKKEIERKAAEIRERIFELIGVPEAPTFGEAYEIAKQIQRITSVRPAFLLAILTQESNIGKNVGQCYLKNSATGEGVLAFNGRQVAKVMKPNRDAPHFLRITKELGRDPYNTPVSCPMSFGWGGAMGPAQFIPSTWALYEERLKSIVGKPGDPWNIRDSFLAAGLYLSDAGAGSQTYDSEWKAAMIYFSGSTSSKYRFYGDSVMRITKDYEKDIAALEKAK